MEKLKLCKYPTDAFGRLAGQKYLLDKYGNRYDFEHHYSHNEQTTIWEVTINGQTYYGESIPELIETLKFDYKITKW